MEFNFNLTEQESQIMLNALLKEPYGVVANVVSKIQQQAFEQRNKKEIVAD